MNFLHGRWCGLFENEVWQIRDMCDETKWLRDGGSIRGREIFWEEFCRIDATALKKKTMVILRKGI